MTYSWIGEKLNWIKNQRKIGTQKIGDMGSNKKMTDIRRGSKIGEKCDRIKNQRVIGTD